MIKAINALEYFMLRDWTFHNENVQGLWKSLSDGDRQMYHFAIDDLDWGKYIDRYQRGCKKFILREGTTDSDIEKAHKNMNRLLWYHRILQMALMYVAWSMLSSDLSVSMMSAMFNEAVRALNLVPILAGDEEHSLPEPSENFLSS